MVKSKASRLQQTMSGSRQWLGILSVGRLGNEMVAKIGLTHLLSVKRINYTGQPACFWVALAPVLHNIISGWAYNRVCQLHATTLLSLDMFKRLCNHDLF